MVNSLVQLQKSIHSKKNLEKAKILQGFFKTGKGQYGEGDIFFGITVPESRKIAKEFGELPLFDIEKLLESKIHEERVIALLILVDQFEIGDEKEQKECYDFYLDHTAWINNWDLVDLTAHKIVGEYLLEKNTKILTELVHSKNLWEKRIGIVATLAFIRKGKLSETFRLSKILMNDNHDLIHKAVGWMLREAGKRDEVSLEVFLEDYAAIMPRTMLRYAIEKFLPDRRAYYLKKK